jgi:hypothetical protein
MGDVPLWMDEALQSLGFKHDNPSAYGGNRSWVESKQRNARPSTYTNGPSTAYFRDNVHIPTELLAGVPGANNELPAPGEVKYDRLTKDVLANGWEPHPIAVAVNHLGQPYIMDGNNRSALAQVLGISSIPARLEWVNGAEEVAGKWNPRTIAKDLLQANEAASTLIHPSAKEAAELLKAARAKEVQAELIGRLRRFGR